MLPNIFGEDKDVAVSIAAASLAEVTASSANLTVCTAPSAIFTAPTA